MIPPATIAHYKITGKLGEGGMGAVYRATDTKLNRDVAIKVLPDSFAADPDRLARFTREAQVLASLNHPNIAAIYGVEERALVLELVEGPTLADRIAQGPIPLDEAIPIAGQIAEALEYAHEKGIVHRDLKPANVKVTPEGRVKVLDFGLAKALIPDAPSADPSSSPTLTMRATMAGAIMGTAGYMSPEQAKGKPADRRADIWAFGILLSEMISGRVVFAAETVSEILAAVIMKEPEIPPAPPHVQKLLRRCLDRDPAQRLQAIGEARIILANPGVAAPAEPTSPVAPSRSSRIPWIAAGIATLAALVFAGLWLKRPVEEPRNVSFSVPAPEKTSFGTGSGIAISPDGRHLAFAAEQDNQGQVWIRDLDDATARPLTGTGGMAVVGSVFWSPDSRYVGFFQAGKLKKIDIQGGQPVTLCDAQNPRGGAWSSRDVIVFAATSTSGLMRVSAAGGVPTPVTELDAKVESSHRWPWFLPDGRRFLFLARATTQDKSAVWLGDLDSQDRRRLVTSVSNAAYDPRGFLLFVRESTLVALPWDAGRAQATGEAFPVAEQVEYTPNNAQARFSLSQNGVLAWISGSASGNMQLTWFGRDGQPLGTLGPPGQMQTAAISPDGTTVVTNRLDPRTATTDLWLHDAIHNTDSRFTFDPAPDDEPVWSPDGARVAFNSTRDGKPGIWIKPAAGNGKEELLLEWPNPVFVSDWSRDGRFLILTSVLTQTRPDIFVMSDPLDPAKRKTEPYLQTPASEHDARLSPDGRWMAYSSDESRDFQVYVSSFPGKESKFQISSGGGIHPFWSRDGKELFYLTPERVLMGVQVSGGPRFDHAAPRVLFQTRVTTSSVPGISPDGKRFLMPSLLSASRDTPIHVITNWHAGVAIR